MIAARARSCTVRAPVLGRSVPAAPARVVRVQAQQPTGDKQVEDFYESTEKVVADLKNKWDKTEEKPAAIGLAVASIVALYVMNGVVNAVDRIPVISGVLELVGIFVTSWFVYRYLVFGPDRQELKQNINQFFSKVAGK